MRLQLALNVDDIDQAVDFYSKLFDATPHKRKPGYANFAIQNPPLKLVLFEVKGAPERLNHLGVEVEEAEEVTAATERLKAAGLADLVEDDFERMAQLVEQYESFPLGGSDASVIAIAERRSITTLLTIDRRHFAAVRPRPVEAFPLLP